jgi:sulfur relay (sulfurtransferase) complex TusBCD TusD component (DsrE family)
MSLGRRLSFGIISAALVACPLAAGCASIVAPAAHAQAPQTAQSQQIVVHLGSFTNDLHSAFMALSLATNLQKAGAKVTVFLDREGVRLADVRERGDLTWGDSGGSSAAMTEFVQAGGKVVLCPHCASLAGIEATHVRAGARIATHDEVAAIFLAADKVVDF